MVHYYESSEGEDMRLSGWYFSLDNEAHSSYGPYETEHDALEAYAQALRDLP